MSQPPSPALSLENSLQDVIQSIGGATEAARFLTQFLAESWLTTTLLISNVAKDPAEAEIVRQGLLNSLANPRHRSAVITLLGRLFAECAALHSSSPSLSSSSSSSSSPAGPWVAASGSSPVPSSPASILRRESPVESPDAKKARKLPEDKFHFLNPAHESFWSYFIVCSELRETEHASVVCCPGCGTALKSTNANNMWAHMTEKCKHKHNGALLAAPAANFVAPSTAPAAEIVTRFAALTLPVKAKLPEAWRAPLDQLVAAARSALPSGQPPTQDAVLPPAPGVTPPAAAAGMQVSGEEPLPSPMIRGDGSFGSNLSATSLAQFLDPAMRVDGATIDPQAVFRLGPDVHSPR
jgi:hypothetical protein